MKKILGLLILISLFGSLFAQNSVAVADAEEGIVQNSIADIDDVIVHNSVADTDNFLAAEVNTAAVAYGNAGGVGFKFPYQENADFGERFTLFVSGDEGGYMMHKIHDFYIHKLYTAEELFNNFYLGMDWQWENDRFAKGGFNLNTLYRPHNALSIGFVANDIFYDTRNYTAGVALRPSFLGDNAHRVSFSVDMDYMDEDFSDPRFGMQTELVNGITLGGNYDLETEAIGINFGINFGNMTVGSQGVIDNKNGDNSEYPEADYYYHASDKVFKSLFAKQKASGLYEFKSKKVVEKRSGARLGNFVFFSNDSTTLIQILDRIEKLKNDPTIEGIVFKNTNISASIANLIEIKKALIDFKTSGKKIIFYSEGYGNVGYAFAAAVADEIYLYKTGSIDLKGISVNSPYVKGLMDKLGVKMENFRSHKYKTAGNMFSETAMTEAERESYSFLLDGLYDEMKIMIDEGRRDKLKFDAEETINNGPYYIAAKALENGLVDGLIYEDQLEDILAEKFDSGKITKDLAGTSAKTEWSKDGTQNVAIIYAIGSIHMGKGKPGKTIGSVTTANAIRKARKDKSIKGIILVVNSGGGSALASDIIGREVELCKSGENKKPIVSVMTGTAASGGYYISALADKIIAQPATVTGSIGVIGMMFNFTGLYEKIGVNWSSVKKGDYSDLGNSSRPMTEDEHELIAESIENVYDEFISIVARGRGMSKEEVHEVARGRVWTGKQAMERGLVDMMGGIDTGIEVIKDMANIDCEVKTVEFTGYDKNKTIEINMGFEMSTKLPSQLQLLKDVGDELGLYGNEKVLMLMPKMEIK